jgi:hypothetical protein
MNPGSTAIHWHRQIRPTISRSSALEPSTSLSASEPSARNTTQAGTKAPGPPLGRGEGASISIGGISRISFRPFGSPYLPTARSIPRCNAGSLCRRGVASKPSASAGMETVAGGAGRGSWGLWRGPRLERFSVYLCGFKPSFMVSFWNLAPARAFSPYGGIFFDRHTAADRSGKLSTSAHCRVSAVLVFRRRRARCRHRNPPP